MKTTTGILSLAACAAAVVAFATAADARPRKRVVTRGDVIVVHPRPFTDSGNVVPVGSRSLYVQMSTTYNQQPLERYSPGILWRPDPGTRW
jgi:hypothetical protein